MASHDRTTEPKDYYGEALAANIRDGRENPELVAALMAQIAEAVDDALALMPAPRPDYKLAAEKIQAYLGHLKSRGRID
jgi:hypothetical protein